MHGKRQGYTLVEILAVLAILVVVGSISVPIIGSMLADGKARAAADELRTRWSQSRSKAMSEGRSYRFAYQENSGKFRIAPDSPEYWSEGGESVDDSEEKAWILESELPGGTEFGTVEDGDHSGASGSGKWTHKATFQANGTAKVIGRDGQDAELSVKIGRPGTHGTTLKLSGSTASVSTSEGPRP